MLAWRRSQELKKKQDETWAAIEESRREHDQQHHAELVARRKKGYYRKLSEAKPKESLPRPDHPQFSLVLKGLCWWHIQIYYESSHLATTELTLEYSNKDVYNRLQRDK